MPSCEEFLSSFNFIKGVNFGRYVISNIECSRQTKKIFKEYTYNVNIIFQPIFATNHEELFNSVHREISSQKYFYSAKNNRYICKLEIPIFGDITEDEFGNIKFVFVGNATKECKGYSCF